MLALITSCGREDLLKRTIDSLYKDQKYPFKTIIHEDSGIQTNPIKVDNLLMVGTGQIGQHKSIELFLSKTRNDKYYLHCEDDWEFHNTYDWISESIKIMEDDPSIIKVLCRYDSPHPCEFKNGYGILEPWTDPWKGHVWHGFGWNPGVTRLDLIKQFLPLPKTEQEISKAIYEVGYRTVLLQNGVCKHIGEDRSTHEN